MKLTKVIGIFCFSALTLLTQTASANGPVCSFEISGLAHWGDTVNINFECKVSGNVVATRDISIPPPYNTAPNCSLNILDESAYQNTGSCLSPSIDPVIGCNVGKFMGNGCSTGFPNPTFLQAVETHCGAGCGYTVESLGTTSACTNPAYPEINVYCAN